jgi:2,4-dienoyl-CoA reductase-like NADH-dependent reductase (Old Yellow Enzyme family)
LTEIADEVRKRTSSTFSISIKLNSVEFQESGLQPEDAKRVCSILEDNGFDWVELSGGTYQKLAWDYSLYGRESTKKREAFFMGFADMIAPSLTKTKVYVTGGFKTIGAMVDALSTIDGIGLGRPACQEPNLPKDILSGKVKGAIQTRLDENNFGLQVVAAGTQMQQISQDRNPIDLSQIQQADAFVKDMGTWLGKVQRDSEKKMYGYVDITSVPPIPYGTARAALA